MHDRPQIVGVQIDRRIFLHIRAEDNPAIADEEIDRPGRGRVARSVADQQRPPPGHAQGGDDGGLAGLGGQRTGLVVAGIPA